MKQQLMFTLERETKNTVRYQEKADEGEHTIGTLYVQKKAFKDGKFPESLTVTLVSS